MAPLALTLFWNVRILSLWHATHQIDSIGDIDPSGLEVLGV